MNQLATTQPIVLPDFKPVFADEEVRQYPDAKFPFLRFQIGRKIDRPMLEPIFEGKAVTGYLHNGRNVSVFRLLGWGETLEAAQRMARRAK